MALYTKDSRDRVRDAVDFVELVGARTELRRAGPTRYEGLCPFHDERTPSFGIDPVQKVYHCFGCQASGDVFTFVQETEGVDFKGALEMLADRYGVELKREQEDPEEERRRRRRERLLELLARTSAYYARYLWESDEAAHARDYLTDRGLGEEILRAFGVGYAPSAWDRVLTASRSGGFTVEELFASGLAQRSKQTGDPYDRFRARVMFPLADVRGRVLGFGARALREDQRPKYLNTSDNDVYHKGLHLYGAHLARPHAAREGTVILCEGYTDVIALHQAGVRNAVGLMGTALTAEQVGELSRMAQRVLLALDADSAGQEAMLRAAALAARRRLELQVVPLPAGADPAELIQREGAGAMSDAVAAAVPFVRFRVERALASGDTESPEGKDRIIGELQPVFATIPAQSAVRMELMGLVSSRLDLPEGAAERLLGRTARAPAAGSGNGAPRAGAGAARPTADAGTRGGAGEDAGGGGRQGAEGGAHRRSAPVRVELSKSEQTERAFLALCLADPEEGERELSQMDPDTYFSSGLLRRAALRLRAAGLRHPLGEAPGEEVPLEEDPQLAALLAELVVEAGGEEPRPAMIHAQRLQLELARLDRDIRRARASRESDVSTLAARRGEVKREFDAVYMRVLEETAGS